ncbi:MAG: prepilin-type N-terminal cleavage/methylation domain-containing protein [Terrisporobacter sp.]|uniref:prepilin-type N-terminal cleavage/methylation domain-containing protein n=1 Tax=Terrisporobacter sp. TaxID=1965305 RepID=UPI002FCB77ED
MKNKKGYILLECIISLTVIMILSLSLYSILLFSNNYKQIVEDKVELYEQGQEMTLQINKLIENSKGIINIKDLSGKTIFGNTNSYINVKSIKCKYKDEDNTGVKDKEISYKSNKKLFINTLNNGGNSEAGGYEIGDYVDNISIMITDNKISIKLLLSKNDEKYETDFKSYIRDF